MTNRAEGLAAIIGLIALVALASGSTSATAQVQCLKTDGTPEPCAERSATVKAETQSQETLTPKWLDYFIRSPSNDELRANPLDHIKIQNLKLPNDIQNMLNAAQAIWKRQNLTGEKLRLAQIMTINEWINGNMIPLWGEVPIRVRTAEQIFNERKPGRGGEPFIYATALNDYAIAKANLLHELRVPAKDIIFVVGGMQNEKDPNKPNGTPKLTSYYTVVGVRGWEQANPTRWVFLDIREPKLKDQEYIQNIRFLNIPPYKDGFRFISQGLITQKGVYNLDAYPIIDTSSPDAPRFITKIPNPAQNFIQSPAGQAWEKSGRDTTLWPRRDLRDNPGTGAEGLRSFVYGPLGTRRYLTPDWKDYDPTYVAPRDYRAPDYDSLDSMRKFKPSWGKGSPKEQREMERLPDDDDKLDLGLPDPDILGKWDQINRERKDAHKP
jgi:hypothetical protein